MPSIQTLPPHVADLIAAGEVVERPASVIKELCENAIDAGATAITIEIRSGGVRYMRVTDNGCGMPPNEVRTAFLPHATSKLRHPQDLDAIATLGFRGEALPSIAAVARVQTLTRQKGSELGMRYEIEAGHETVCEEAGCPEGTTFVVRDLFFKTPARLKFLRKDATEGALVAAVAEKLALASPQVRYTLQREGKTVFQSPGNGSLGGAVRAVLGKAFYAPLLGLQSSTGHVQVQGFVSEPAAARPNRLQQYIFLNRRYIKCPTASAALAEAFKGCVQVGKHPACVLYLTMPPDWVDVNVHPAKTEVRFADDRMVFSAVYHAAMSVLQPQSHSPQAWQSSGASEPVPLQPPEPPPPGPVLWSNPAPALQDSAGSEPLWAEPEPSLALPGLGAQPSAPAAPTHYVPPQSFAPAPNPSKPQPPQGQQLCWQQEPEPGQPPALTDAPPEPLQWLGEAFATYFVVQQGEQLLLIDKHAAHERILYDQLKAQQSAGRRQVLLAPLPLELSREQVAVLCEHAGLLQSAGFYFEEFGAQSLVLRECPMLLTEVDLNAQLQEIAGYLLSGRGNVTTEAEDWILHSAACRAAVKAGDATSAQEAMQFVRQLQQMPQVHHCPHGRPVYASFTKNELEKRFGRV